MEISQSHLADKQLLLDVVNGFDRCNIDLAALQVQSETLSNAVGGASASHDSCRMAQQSHVAARDIAFAQYMAGASSQAPPPDVVNCMQHFVLGFSPETRDDLQAMTVCAQKIKTWSGAFNETMTSLGNNYEASLHLVGNRSEDCRVNQSILESTICEYMQQLTDSCAAMDSCVKNVNTTGHPLLASIEASNIQREESFIAATKVICYIQVLRSNLTAPSVQSCQNLVVNTFGVAVTIPTPASPDICDTSPVATFPCELAWEGAEYFNKTWYTEQPRITPDTCPGLCLWTEAFRLGPFLY